MAIFIQTDTGFAGTGSVFPAECEGSLWVISNQDPGFGHLSPVLDLIQVTYTGSTANPCPRRLNDLVNWPSLSPVFTDTIVVGSDMGFVLSDGSVVGSGITLPPHTPDNPSGVVLVIYDTTDNNGHGVCVKRETGSQRDVASPPSVILYHELSHAYRICTNAALSLAASGCAASPEEHAAEVDENDMRDQLGIAHRDPNDHCANVGCHTCCLVVASVASGSPYSAEVNALRDVRDGFLRQSEVGMDFFDRLHTDYYTFSPQVCGMMARSSDLKTLIRAYFVQPLTEILRLIYEYTVEHCTSAELGARFDAAVTAAPSIASLTASEVAEIEQTLGEAALPAPPQGEMDVSDLGSLLRERAHSSEFVKWALIDTLSMYLEGVRFRLIKRDPEALGLRLAEAIDAWASRLPITDVWSRLSRYDRGVELEFLKRALLRTPVARSWFASRLLAFFDEDERMCDLIRDHGYVEGDT